MGFYTKADSVGEVAVIGMGRFGLALTECKSGLAKPLARQTRFSLLLLLLKSLANANAQDYPPGMRGCLSW